MGISTQSKVAFICKNDESPWAERFKETPNVPGAGYWEHEDNMKVPCELLENRSNGQVLIFNSDYYGIISPARMDLPASLQAVVCQSYSCQGEEQDPIYAVVANNIRAHDFSDLNPALKSCWFGLENERSQLQNAIDEAAEEQEATYSSDDFYDSIDTLLINKRDKAFEDLVAVVEQMAELATPFSDNPELASYLGYLKSINSEDAYPEDWMTDYDGSPMPPASSAYTNEDVINHEHIVVDLSEILTEEQVVAAKEKYETAKKAKELFEAETAAFKPITQGYRPRAEIREALLKAALGGETDTTGIWTLLSTKAGTDAYPVPGREMQRLVAYIASRLERPNSEIARELETSTEGTHIFNLIDNLVQRRKWEKFELPTETKKEEVKVEIPKDQVKELENIDENYNMLVLISDDDYNDCIAGDPDEEGAWEPVINQAKATKCWRYIPAKAYLNESGERLSEEEHAANYKMSLDVISFVECCYSPKWADGFDYTPLWEAAMSDGSIDGDDVDVDKLSQMIKARQYWMGDNGGYQVVEGTSDTPLNKTDFIATLVKRGLDGLEGNSWLTGHQNVACAFFLTEAWDSDMEAMLSQFAEYVNEQDVSEEEYLLAGKPVVERYVADLLGSQTMKANFQWALDVLSQQADGDTAFKLLSLAYIKRHPEHRDALWEMLFDGDAGSENWEELLSGQWFDEFKDKIELSAKTIDDEWAQGGDYSAFGAEVAEVFKRGLELCTTPATIDFTCKRVCVTGKLSQTRKEIESLLEAAGATIASGVSKTTDYLIAGEDAGSKLAKAQELGVIILSEEQLMSALGHS